MNMGRQPLGGESEVRGLADSPEAAIIALTRAISDALLANVARLLGREVEAVKQRLVVVSGKFRAEISRLLATRDPSRVISGVLDLLSGKQPLFGGDRRNKPVALDGLAQKLPRMSWASYVSVLGDDVLTPEDLGLVLEYFPKRCGMSRRDFFAQSGCPVSQYVGDRLVNRRKVQGCFSMEWTPDRLRLKQWMLEQARARIG